HRSSSQPTSSTSSSNCWSKKLGYKCCKSSSPVYLTDSDGQWGVENNEWCGIVHRSSCWATKFGFKCCSAKCPQEVYIDKDGSWGVENNNWCGI
ncbi:Non-catalytic module family DOC2, partial [Piromyces sp. E2]